MVEGIMSWSKEAASEKREMWQFKKNNTIDVDMPKGRGCDRKWQAEEDWIRAVALLRLWGCDKGVSNVSLLARQRGVLGGSEGAKNSSQAIRTTGV